MNKILNILEENMAIIPIVVLLVIVPGLLTLVYFQDIKIRSNMLKN